MYISKHWNKTLNTLSRLITKSPQHTTRASHSLLWRCLYTLQDTYAIHVTPRKVTLCHLRTIQPKCATHGRSIAYPQYETNDPCTQHITRSQCTKFRRTRQKMIQEDMCRSQNHTTHYATNGYDISGVHPTTTAHCSRLKRLYSLHTCIQLQL